MEALSLRKTEVNQRLGSFRKRSEILSRDTPATTGDCLFSKWFHGCLACGPGEEYVKGQQGNYHLEQKIKNTTQRVKEEKSHTANAKLYNATFCFLAPQTLCIKIQYCPPTLRTRMLVGCSWRIWSLWGKDCISTAHLVQGLPYTNNWINICHWIKKTALLSCPWALAQLPSEMLTILRAKVAFQVRVHLDWDRLLSI